LAGVSDDAAATDKPSRPLTDYNIEEIKN